MKASRALEKFSSARDAFTRETKLTAKDVTETVDALLADIKKP